LFERNRLLGEGISQVRTFELFRLLYSGLKAFVIVLAIEDSSEGINQILLALPLAIAGSCCR
jgi:hypothetical protein